jgi:prefoldin alpha subunit
MEEKELNYKLQLFEQQIIYFQEQINFIDQALIEMSGLKQILDEIKNKKEQEILSPIGRGVFVKAKIISDEILVDIGNKNIVTKTIPEAKELIEEQINKIEENRKKLEEELKNIEKQMETFFMENQKDFRHNHKCECENEENCECGKKK